MFTSMKRLLRQRGLTGHDTASETGVLLGGVGWTVVRIIACVIIAASIVGTFTASSVLDDSYMFARYADNLLNGRGISFNPGSSPTYGLTSPGYLIVVIPFRLFVRHSPPLAMLFSSLCSGLAFLAITAMLIRLVGRSIDARWRQILSLVVLAALAHAASDLSVHFVSGMDTMFGLAYIGLYLVIITLFEKTPSLRNTFAAGILGGAAFWIRPDLLLYTVGIPAAIALFSKDPRTRINSCVALAVTVAFTGLIVIANVQYFGSALPLPFYAKTLHLYGQTIEAVYRYEGLIQLHRYVASYAILLSIVVIAAASGRKAWWESLSGVGKGALVSTVLFMVFYCCFVLQIMPQSQRFYYPSLPGILLVTFESIRYFARMHDPEFTQSSRFRRTAVFVLFAFYVTLPSAIWNLDRLSMTPGIWAKGFQLVDEYRDTWSGYWFCLDKFSALPDDAVFAATEVGYPIGMNPRKCVIDLTGLNETTIAHEKFSADIFFSVYQPDVIFMPHVHYAEMTANILADPFFRTNYDFYSPQITGTELGISIKRTSKYYRRMKDIVERNAVGGVLSGRRD
jgi:hypothetical protein